MIHHLALRPFKLGELLLSFFQESMSFKYGEFSHTPHHLNQVTLVLENCTILQKKSDIFLF